MPLADDLMVADLHRANFGDPVRRSPATRRLNIDDDVILLRIETISDPRNGSDDSGLVQLTK